MAASHACADAGGTVLCSFLWPSLGSIGHPDTCAVACKYNGKVAGCKDGQCCVRCHLCTWRRDEPKVNMTAFPLSDTGERTMDDNICAGVSTPDPPSVFNNTFDPDESHESLLEGAVTPREVPHKEGRMVGPLEIAGELHRKLCTLQGQKKISMDEIEEETTPMTSHLLAHDNRVKFDQAEEFGVKESAAAVTVPSSLPDFQALLMEADVDTPVPPPPAAPEDARGQRYPHVTSMGSVGHPQSCAAPCKYVRRKTGCRDGLQCTKCHQCHWQRERAVLTEDLIEERFSVGTQGHPHTCGSPCKYVRRKTGCRNGAGCESCHLCIWQRDKSKAAAGPAHPYESDEAAVAMAQGAAYLQTLGFERADDERCAESKGCFSVGSIGHPFSCAGEGCKYNSKAKGCKDGRFCLRCHLCSWRR